MEENKPFCFEKFEKDSVFCVKNCKHNFKCSKGEFGDDEILKLRMKKSKGEIDFKQFVKKGMQEVRKKAVCKKRVPRVDIFRTPKVDKAKIDKMDWINN